MSKRTRTGKSTKGQSSNSQKTIEERVRNLRVFRNETYQMNYDALVHHLVHSGTIIDWYLFAEVLKGVSLRASILTHSLDLNGKISSKSTNRYTVSWVMNSLPLFRFGILLVKIIIGPREFILGDKINTELALRNAMMVDEHRLMKFWPTIEDGEFTTESMVAKMIRAPRVRGKENGEMLKDSIENGAFQLKPETIVKDTDSTTDITRPQKVKDLTQQEKLQYDNDIKAVNILLLGFPVDIYTLINHYQTTKET
nr:hypothetical protein [Tanacetum cinerariifolium]